MDLHSLAGMVSHQLGISLSEALLRLRQACCHMSLVPGQNALTSAKLDLLIDTLEGKPLPAWADPVGVELEQLLHHDLKALEDLRSGRRLHGRR